MGIHKVDSSNKKLDSAMEVDGDNANREPQKLVRMTQEIKQRWEVRTFSLKEEITKDIRRREGMVAKTKVLARLS